LCAALIAASSALAQQPAKLFRIGWLGSGAQAAHLPLQQVFIDGMRELGWVEGRHFVIEGLYADGHIDRLPALAAELMQRRVDLIITIGTPATSAARDATTTIPIVFGYVSDAVAMRFATSLAHPGGNLTGLGGQAAEMHAKALELLKAALPNTRRVAMTFAQGFAPHAIFRAEVEPAALKLGLTLVPVEMRDAEEVDAAFAAMARAKVDAVLFLGHPILYAQTAQFVRLAIEQRLPSLAPAVEMARVGVLMCFGTQVTDSVRQLPYYVDRILKGTKPAELPVQQATLFRLAINLKTAKAIGLTIPQGVLLRADEVIE